MSMTRKTMTPTPWSTHYQELLDRKRPIACKPVLSEDDRANLIQVNAEIRTLEAIREQAPEMLEFLKRFECNGGCGPLRNWRDEARAILRAVKGE